MPNSRPTIPVPTEPGIPEHAPTSAKAIALALDRMTGGDGRFVCLTDSLTFDTTEALHRFLTEV